MKKTDDLLPNISIKSDVEPRKFISRIYQISKQFDHIKAKKIVVGSDSLPLVSIKFNSPESFKLQNLFGLFAIRPWGQKRAWVELSSSSWANSSPSYDNYVQLLKETMGPFLSAYNQKFKSRRRFYIPSKEQIESKLSNAAIRVFNRFVDTANKSFLHPRDWRNFYSFVRVCHRRKENITTDNLERLLIKSGFSEDYIEKLCCIFEHGLGILRREYYPSHIQELIFSDEYIKKRHHIIG